MAKFDDLEKWIDEIIQKSQNIGYHPTTFIRMRAERGTINAIKNLIISGDIQYGFKILKKLDRLDLSIETAVLKFPSCFTKEVVEAAEFRLEQVGRR